jgi:hypothetical protein
VCVCVCVCVWLNRFTVSQDVTGRPSMSYRQPIMSQAAYPSDSVIAYQADPLSTIISVALKPNRRQMQGAQYVLPTNSSSSSAPIEHNLWSAQVLSNSYAFVDQNSLAIFGSTGLLHQIVDLFSHIAVPPMSTLTASACAWQRSSLRTLHARVAPISPAHSSYASMSQRVALVTALIPTFPHLCKATLHTIKAV